MEHDRAVELVARIGVLHQLSDLDLLIFFARHPRILIASEPLAALTGYGPQQTAESLEVLVNAGLITRSQKPPRTPSLYLFVPAAGAEWIHELFKLATTRTGRIALRRALAARSQAPRAALPDAAGIPVEARAPRRFLVTTSLPRSAPSGEQREEA